MRKSLLLIAFALSTLFANAQFVNPYVYNDKEFFNSVVSATYNGELTSEAIPVPQDTIVDKGVFGFSYFVSHNLEDAPVETLKYATHYGCSGQLRDHYNKLPFEKWVLESEIQPFHAPVGKTEDFHLWGIEYGGHYYWSWKTKEGDVAQNGHFQVNTEPGVSIKATNIQHGKPAPNAKMIIMSTIRTGFPYDLANYQGNTKYTVFDPDSNIVKVTEAPIKFSPDSTMMEQTQENLVDFMQSAKEGIYNVMVEAQYLKEPIWFRIPVVDSLATATSEKGAEASLRLKEPTFVIYEKPEYWEYNGTAKPTYFIDFNRKPEIYSAMIVRSEEGQPGGAFSVTQSVGDMPKGIYTLEWPVAYQPRQIKDVRADDEILAYIEANGVKADAVNILAGAKEEIVEDGDKKFIRTTLPANNDAVVSKMFREAFSYTAKVTFEVVEDGMITIGVHKAASTLTDDATFIGEPVITYYGKGLPYGSVRFPSQTEYKPGDEIAIKVNLHDGIGTPVPADNNIIVMVAPVTDKGVDFEHPIIYKEEPAGAQDYYDVTLNVPAASEVQNGQYAIAVASLENGNEYIVSEMMQIEITGASAIQQVKADSAKADIYTLSGIKLLTPSAAKGVYINDGKKVMK